MVFVYIGIVLLVLYAIAGLLDKAFVKFGMGYAVSPIVSKVLILLQNEEKWDFISHGEVLHTETGIIVDTGMSRWGNYGFSLGCDGFGARIRINRHEEYLLSEAFHEMIKTKDEKRCRRAIENRREKELWVKKQMLKKLGEDDEIVIDYLLEEQ